MNRATALKSARDRLGPDAIVWKHGRRCLVGRELFRAGQLFRVIEASGASWLDAVDDWDTRDARAVVYHDAIGRPCLQCTRILRRPPAATEEQTPHWITYRRGAEVLVCGDCALRHRLMRAGYPRRLAVRLSFGRLRSIEAATLHFARLLAELGRGRLPEAGHALRAAKRAAKGLPVHPRKDHPPLRWPNERID